MSDAVTYKQLCRRYVLSAQVDVVSCSLTNDKIVFMVRKCVL